MRRRALRVESLEERRVFAGDISGTVFDDLNRNGIDDPGENGLPGWTVFVDTNGDGTLNVGEPSTMTDTKGKFAILGLPVAPTVVYEIPQDGYVPASGFTDHQTITVREGREVKVKFPNMTAPIVDGRITGTVFEDDNENGVKDPGEHGISGWSMFVDTNGDGSFTAGEPSATTDADGDYLLDPVPAGTATVYEVPVGGLRPIVGGLFPLAGASDHRQVTVASGASVRSDFANLIPPIGTIQGTVVDDVNGDGLKGATDGGLAGRSVYVDLNLNGVQDASEPVRVTDANGAYSFADIHTGTYRVTEVVPAGWSSAIGRSNVVNTTVGRGGVNTIDFFNLQPSTGSLSGVVWDDANGDGLFGATEQGLPGVSVYVDANGNAALDVGELSAVTAADGSYTIAAVPYSAVTIRQILPSNWLATNPTTGARSTIVLNNQTRTGLNFGDRENVGTIQGSVWNDANGNGVRATTEAGLEGWTVFLDVDADGVQDADEPSTLTTAGGGYTLSRVPTGTYQVAEVLPEGWITSIGKPSVVSAAVTLGGVKVVDFYNLVPVAGSVSGTLFADLDSNGAQSATEPALADWQVFVDANNNGALDAGESVATTDAAGAYTLDGVAYGANTIQEVVQVGYTPTNHPGGKFAISLLNGENRTGVSFGNRPLTDFTISGVAFHDQNGNGVRDAGERGLSGIPVYLDTNKNGALDAGEPTMTTLADQFFTPGVDETGTYSFTHLTLGTYTVREIVPIEQAPTPAAAQSLTVTVGPGNQTANFANVFRANEIHGVVFDDTDADHVRDPGEYARPGVSVYIDLDRDDVYDEGEPAATTGDDGSYAFLGLTPGAYIVREHSGAVGPHTYPTTGGGTLWPTGTSHAAVGNVTPTDITTSLVAGQSYTQTVSITLPGAGAITNMVDVFLLFDDTGSFTANSPIVRAAFPEIISVLQSSLPGIDLGFGVGRFEEYASFASESSTGRPFILNQPIVASSTAGFSTSIQAALDRMAPGFGGDGPETDIEALYQVVTGLGFDGNNNGTTSDSGAAGLAATQLSPGASGDVPSFASFTSDAANNVLPAAGTVGGAGFRSGALPIILTATDIGFAYQPKGETQIVGDGGLTLPLSSLTQFSRPSTPFASGAGLQETVTGLNALGALVIGLGTNPDAALDPRQGLESLAKLTGAVNRSTATIDNGTADPIAPGDPFYFQISSGFGATVADGVVNAIQNATTNVAFDIELRASDPRVHIVNHTGTATGVGAGQTATFDVEFVGDGRPHRFDLQFVRAGTSVVVGSIPVVLGTPVVGDAYGYDELEDGEIHRSSHFGNYVENVAPSFTGGADQIVTEDAGVQTIAAWATNLFAGAPTEAGQALNFLVANDNPTLFSVPPTIAPDGTLTFTPAPNAHGSATVTVRLHDDGGIGLTGADTSAAQTFLITVTPVNDAPIVVADSYSTTEGIDLTVGAPGVLANDADVEGDALAAALVTPPAHGTVTFAADGSFIYSPAPGFSGVDTFTYAADDGQLASSPATVTISVARINHAPTAADDLLSTDEDAALTIVAPGLLANDSDPDGDALSASLVSGPAHGTVALAADGSLVYTPNADYFGSDSFSYQVNDGLLTSNIAVVTIDVASVNDAPIAVDEAVETTEDLPLTIAAPGVLANDSDVEGDALSAVLVAGPSHGTVTLNADGSFQYVPAAAFFGIDSFTYRANDGSLESGVATVSITVHAVQHAPTAADDSFATDEDVALDIAAPGLLANDADPEGDALTAALVGGPSHGTLTLNADGSFHYVPALNFHGADSFSYLANDGGRDSNLAVVTIDVRAVNDAPIAGNNSYATNEDVALDVAAPGFLVNDTDVDGDLLTGTLVASPTHGSLTFNGNGSFRYVPAANFNGTDTFTYRADDGTLDSNIATVTISVAAVNDAPTAADNTYSMNEDGTLNVAAPGVLGNDADVDGNALRALRVTGPAHGTLTLNANGSFTYVPTANFNGVDTFTYTANDLTLDSNVATVTINVAAVNDAPVAVNDAYSVERNAALNVAARGVLSNDVDVEGDALTASLVTAPTHGTVTLNADGSLSYTPATNYVGPDSFTYRAADAAAATSGLATVSITVTLPPPKFYVVDDGSKANFRYASTGESLASVALDKSDSKPRGIASNATGSTQWVLDGSGTVFVYNDAGALLGQWTPQNVGKPEGITVWGNDLWLVDPTQDRVFKFTGGATLRSGRVNASSSFALNSGNLNSTDLVTDGAHLWVVNDTVGVDAVFRYTTAGVFEGSWTLAGGNPSPTGITLDPNSVNHLWIVDASTDRVYQYDGATSRLSGSLAASTSFALAATNGSPQGIADPRPAEVASGSTPVVPPLAPAAAKSSSRGHRASPRASSSTVHGAAVSHVADVNVVDDRLVNQLAASRGASSSGSSSHASSVDDVFAELGVDDHVKPRAAKRGARR